MGWFGSIVVAVLVAACSAVAAGFVADRAVIWLRVSQVEGNAGFMALGFGLAGLIGGFVLGLLVSRMLGAGPLPSLGLSLAVAAVVIGAGGGLAWLNRDVDPGAGLPPLALLFEVRLGPGITLSADAPHQLNAGFAADGSRVEMAALRLAIPKPAVDAPDATGEVRLHTRRPNPYLVLGGDRLGGKPLIFDLHLPAPAAPPAAAWSEWQAPRASEVSAADSGRAATRLRYRLVPAER